MTSWPFEATSKAARLTRLAEQVVGIFTQQQASRLGIGQRDLSLFEDDGVIEHLDGSALYRHLAYEFERHTEGLGAWLLLRPSLLADERGRGLHDQTEILTGGMAFELHGGSGPNYEPVFLVDPESKLTPPRGSQFLRRPIQNRDWWYVKGVPVVHPEVALADMIIMDEDEDYVRKCLRDAVAGMNLRLSRLVDLVEPVASRYGVGSGKELFLELLGGDFDVQSDDSTVSVAVRPEAVIATRTLLLVEETL